MRVLYFAWLRTKIGSAREDVAPPPEVATVGQLIEWLKSTSEAHAQALANAKVIKAAVNQEHVGLDHPVKPGDEVALFPPVTGG